MMSDPVVTRIGATSVYDWGGPVGVPTLVLLHGFSDSGLCWPDAVRRWRTAYRVVTLDARGHGASDRLSESELARGPAEVMVAETTTVLAELAAGPVLLVGHSMGGGVGAAIATRRPELVRALVLEDPALGLDPGESAADVAAKGAEFAAWLDDVAADPDAALAAERAAHPTWPPPEFAGWIASKRQTDRAMAATGRIRIEQPWEQAVAAIDVPTVLVTGTAEVIWEGEALTRLRACAPAAVRIAVIEGADHCVRRSRADAFHALVDPWLAERAG